LLCENAEEVVYHSVMAAPERTATSGTFFVTTITSDRRRLFAVERSARSMIDTLQKYRTDGLFKLYAFVVMPDHMHLLITTDDLPKAMQHVKGGFSRSLGSKMPVWQRGFADHLVRNREEFESRRGCIHQNPVRAGLADTAEEYPFSSAFRGGERV
jgi:putative transposase